MYSLQASPVYTTAELLRVQTTFRSEKTHSERFSESYYFRVRSPVRLRVKEGWTDTPYSGTATHLDTSGEMQGQRTWLRFRENVEFVSRHLGLAVQTAGRLQVKIQARQPLESRRRRRYHRRPCRRMSFSATAKQITLGKRVMIK
jgi:hypothetical protein